MTRRDVTPEPLPSGGRGDVMNEVILDIADRIDHGETKYGQRVRAYNGRNSVRDAYQEALDLTVYLKQTLMEEEHDHDAQLKHLVDEWGAMGVVMKIMERMNHGAQVTFAMAVSQRVQPPKRLLYEDTPPL